MIKSWIQKLKVLKYSVSHASQTLNFIKELKPFVDSEIDCEPTEALTNLESEYTDVEKS